MKNIFLIIVFSVLSAQGYLSFPFDWSGQNGVNFENGKLFTNKSWTSGVLLFDGTYSSYVNRYGGHSSKNLDNNDLKNIPKISPSSDSSITTSFFDYSRGDYLHDKLDLGLSYLTPEQTLELRGFKRSYAGNMGHYLISGSNPIHHSYRMNYGLKKEDQLLEISIGRYITKSGLPDSLFNGLENENIINSGIRFTRNLGSWKIDSYYSQFFQSRIINHSSLIDSAMQAVNRSQFDLRLVSLNKLEIGIRRSYQQINFLNYGRNLFWNQLYLAKDTGRLLIMAGGHIENNGSIKPLWLIKYKQKIIFSHFNFSYKKLFEPSHPNMPNNSNNILFNPWEIFKIDNDLKLRNFSAKIFFSFNSLKHDRYKKEEIKTYGGDFEFSFNGSWKTYYKTITQLDSSIYSGGFKLYNSYGLKGKIGLFDDNMKISFHIWSEETIGRVASFGYNSIQHRPFYNTNLEHSLKDFSYTSAEIIVNISGVLVNYRINNIFDAVKDKNTATPVRPNHIYPAMGRMMQFGVSWNFNN